MEKWNEEQGSLEGSEIFSHYTKTIEVVPFKRYIGTNKMAQSGSEARQKIT